MTLVCKDANSKLVEVVTVADIDDEDCVGNSLLQIRKLKFGHKAKLLFRLWAQSFGQDFEVEIQAKFWSWSLFSILLLMFGWDFEVNAKLRFCNWNLIKICVKNCDMTSTLGSVVLLAMFLCLAVRTETSFSLQYFCLLPLYLLVCIFLLFACTRVWLILLPMRWSLPCDEAN